jgi:hypothetical protein
MKLRLGDYGWHGVYRTFGHHRNTEKRLVGKHHYGTIEQAPPFGRRRKPRLVLRTYCGRVLPGGWLQRNRFALPRTRCKVCERVLSAARR